MKNHQQQSLSKIEEDKKFIETFEFEENKTDNLSKKKCLKNLIVISVSFFFLSGGHSSIANLQSSLNSEGSLGTVSLCTIFAAFFFSCLFLPSLLMAKFSYKWSLFFCEFGYFAYILANLYVKWWTLIPAAVILGLGAAPLWSLF